jgi:hypothetical protein
MVRTYVQQCQRLLGTVALYGGSAMGGYQLYMWYNGGVLERIPLALALIIGGSWLASERRCFW